MDQEEIKTNEVGVSSEPAVIQTNKSFCSNCGNPTSSDSKFCQHCGKTIGQPVDIDKNAKNYSPIFWNYFGIGVLLNIFGRATGEGTGILIIYILVFVIYIYRFSVEINEAMASIGKKNWWPLGLLSLIPFGFWVAFLVVRSKLKPHGMWISKNKSFKLTK